MPNPQKVQIKSECRNQQCKATSTYHIEIRENASKTTGGVQVLVKKCTTCGTDNRLELPANMKILHGDNIVRDF
ncbi:MAG: hypothetical protein ACPGXL_00055 [Chitinophagales bacterium]